MSRYVRLTASLAALMVIGSGSVLAQEGRRTIIASPLTVALAQSFAGTAVLFATEQNRQIERYLDEMRQVSEDAEGAFIATAGLPRATLLAAADSGTSFGFGTSQATVEGFRRDLAGLAEQRFNVFANGFVAYGSRNGEPGLAGSDFTQPGLSLGGSYLLPDGSAVGASFRYSHNGTDIHGGGNSDTNGYLFSAFGSFRPTPLSFIELAVGYGHFEADVSRPVATKTAASSFGSDQINGSLRSGYDFTLAGMRLTPYAAMRGTHNSTPSYDETGAGNSQDIAYPSHPTSSLTLSGGVAAAYHIATPLGLIVPTARAEYVHEFYPDTGAYTAHSVNNLFTVPISSVHTASDYALLGVGAWLQRPSGLKFSLSLDRTVGQDPDEYTSVNLAFSSSF